VQKKDWEGFLARLPAQLQRYQAMGIGYAQTPFEVRSALVEERKRKSVEVSLSNSLGYPDIRYTTDGSEPSAGSAAYKGPFSLALPAKLRASVFVDGKPLAKATDRKLDAASLLTRSDEELAMCTGALMLRLEDDGPAEAERAIFNADIFNPCWEWKAADLAGIASIEVRAGRLPYYFQLAHDEPSRKFKPAASINGELEIRAGCDGAVLATLPLPAAPDADGFVTLKAPLKAVAGPQNPGPQNLCIFFTGDTRPAMWVLDRVTLRP
jgi:hexosaminidase